VNVNFEEVMIYVYSSTCTHVNIRSSRDDRIGAMTTSQRLRSKRGEGETLRAALLAAGGDLLDETCDVDGLSVRGVTRRAGVSHTALYLHFTDMEHLLRALKVDCFAALGAALAAAGRAAGPDPLAVLRAMGHAYLDYAHAHPGHYALMYHTTKALPPKGIPAEPVVEAGMVTLHLLTAAVARALGRAETDQAVHDHTFALWLGLHGRVGVAHTMPWLPQPDADRYITLLVSRLDG
jgi:AcrR family transcriptional regulator